MKTGSGEGEIQEVRPLLYVEDSKTESTSRGGDILHFQAYILGHAKLIDRDNILNSSD